MQIYSELKVVCYENATAFLRRCREAKVFAYAINHNIMQIATILRNENTTYEPPYWFCTVERDQAVLGAAVYAAPDGLVISDMPSDALDILFDKFIRDIPSPRRIIGEPVAAESIAQRVEESSGIFLAQSTGWHVGQLLSVTAPPLRSPGQLRLANESDLELVVKWGKDYGREKPAFLDISEFMTNKLRSCELYLWDDQVSTTMVTVSGKTGAGARISSVYTPPRHRGLGYASSAVAEVCSNLLESGHEYIVLTWRIGDPAERLYQRLGFRIIGSQQSYINHKAKPL